MPIGHALAADVQIRLVGLELVSTRFRVYWDDTRECVRTLDGELRWYADADKLAYRRSGAVAVEALDERTVYPRGHYERAALMIRSLHDVADWTNVEKLVSVSDDIVHLDGEDGRCMAVVSRSVESGVILNGAGLRPLPWCARVDSLRLISAEGLLLQPRDVGPLSEIPDDAG